MAVYTVSQVTRYIKESLERDALLADLWVSGEASNVVRSAAGHTYFSLKEANTVLRCVMFRNGSGGGAPGERRGRLGPRAHFHLRGSGRPAVHRRPGAPRGHGGALLGAGAAHRQAPERGALRAEPQTPAARVPAAHRRDHLAHRRGLARHPNGGRAAVPADGAGAGPLPRAGRHRRALHHRGLRGHQRRAWNRRRYPGARGRLDGGPVDVQRGARGAGRLRQPPSGHQRRGARDQHHRRGHGG